MEAGEDHEVAVCVVALELLASQRCGGAVEILDRPDRRERREQAVDLIARDRVGEFAVEHTGLDSFPGQRDEGAWLQQALAPLEAELSGTLGAAGTFRLMVPHGALRGMPPEGSGARGGTSARLDLHDCPGLADRLSGRLIVSRAPPDELEALRQLVAARALERKAPKLERARQGHRTTVLVLEGWDVALANAGVVATAVKEACGQFTGPLPGCDRAGGHHWRCLHTRGGLGAGGRLTAVPSRARRACAYLGKRRAPLLRRPPDPGCPAD